MGDQTLRPEHALPSILAAAAQFDHGVGAVVEVVRPPIRVVLVSMPLNSQEHPAPASTSLAFRSTSNEVDVPVF